jgi:hypothetical protein
MLPATGVSTVVVVGGLFMLIAGVIVTRWVRQSSGLNWYFNELSNDFVSDAYDMSGTNGSSWNNDTTSVTVETGEPVEANSTVWFKWSRLPMARYCLIRVTRRLIQSCVHTRLETLTIHGILSIQLVAMMIRPYAAGPPPPHWRFL